MGKQVPFGRLRACFRFAPLALGDSFLRGAFGGGTGHPAGVKTPLFWRFSARLKSCPDTKPALEMRCRWN